MSNNAPSNDTKSSSRERTTVRMESLHFDSDIKSYSQNSLKRLPNGSLRLRPRRNVQTAYGVNSPSRSPNIIDVESKTPSRAEPQINSPDIVLENIELKEKSQSRRGTVHFQDDLSSQTSIDSPLPESPLPLSPSSVQNRVENVENELLRPDRSLLDLGSENQLDSPSPLSPRKSSEIVFTNAEEGDTNLWPNRISMKVESPFIISPQFIFSEHFPRRDIELMYVRANGTISDLPWYHPNEIACSINDPPMEVFTPKSPKYGLHLSSLNVHKYDKERASKPFHPYAPSYLEKNHENFEPIAPLNKLRSNEKIRHPKDFETKNKFQVKLIHIESYNLGSYLPDHFKSEISMFNLTQVLILRGCALTSAHMYAFENFSDLRILDVSLNAIDRYQCFTHLLQKCKYLQIIQASQNPCFIQSEDTSNETSFDKIVLYLLELNQREGYKLESLNGVPINLDTIREVVQRSTSKEHLDYLYTLEYDHIFSDLYRKTTLKNWEPVKITTLNLSSSNLHVFHVGTLYNLRRLSLENNEIETLERAGLEQLSHLKFINFSNNKITDPSCFEVLSYCPSLLQAIISNNPYQKTIEPRLLLIFHTRSLKGLNRTPGIQRIDEIDVTLDERIEAVKRYGSYSPQLVRDYHMELALINCFGHYELRCIKNFCRRIKKLIITNQNLTHFDMKGFVAVEYLDLSENMLREIANLENLKRLKFLDVSENNLNDDKLMQQLKKLSNLRHLILRRTTESSDSRSRFREVRIKKLSLLLDQHPMLSALDNLQITISERVAAMRENGATNYQLNQYIFNVSIMEQVVPAIYRSYTIRRVAPKVCYLPSNITELHLSNLKLVDFACDFSPFTNLELLDLSNNKLVDIIKTGILHCSRLRILDLRNNRINYKVKREFVPIIDHFPDLEILAVAGNPMDLKKESKRYKFLKHLKCMQEYGSKFQILDSRITSIERQKLWKAKGDVEVEAEKIRFQRIMNSRGYTKCAPDEILKVNLNDTELSYVSLSEFSMLQILLLRSCQLKNLTNTGILMLNNLKCLDLRDNFLTSIEDVVTIINSNKYLETISIAGNPFKNSNYRSYLLGCCKELRQPHCMLWELDEQEIRIDEIVEAWNQREKGNAIDTAKFRFHTAVFRKYVTNIGDDIDLNEVEVVRQDIIQLDLSNLKLSYVNFEGFDYLTKLSLANNAITDSDLLRSSLTSISIQELDLSNNRIQNLNTLTAFINQTLTLTMIFFIGNPCYKRDTQENRYIVLSQLAGCKDPDWKLRMLNGLSITVDERISGLTFGGKKSTRVEGFRLTLQLHFRNITRESLKVDLKDVGLYSIGGLTDFTAMTQLILTNNNLSTIPTEVIKGFKSLLLLDIRDNLFNKSTVLSTIAQIPALQVLRLKGNLGIFSKSEPEIYARKLFKSMRALHSIDEVSNPFSLSSTQYQAAQYLWKYFNISPNSLMHLDFTYGNVEKKHFWLIVLCLRELMIVDPENEEEVIGAKSIKIMKGNFLQSHVPEYRFILVSHIRTLQEIDGHSVNNNEKLMTNTSIQKLKSLITLAKGTCPSIESRLSLDNVRKELASLKVRKLEKEEDEMLGDASISDEEENIERTRQIEPLILHGNYNSLERNRPAEDSGEILAEEDITFETIHNYFEYTKIFSVFEQVLKNRNKTIKKFGIMLEKVEHLIFFLQLYSVNYVLNIKWPDMFAMIANFIPLSNLSIESPLTRYNVIIPSGTNYFRYFVVILFPFLLLALFLAPIKKNHLAVVLLKCWPMTLFFGCIFTFIGLVASLLLGFIIDPSSFFKLTSFREIPNPQFFWISACSAIFVLLTFFGFSICMLAFRRARYDDFFWNAIYLKLRTRLSLFFITIAYMPVMRAIMVVYQCASSQNNAHFNTLFMFPAYNCPSSISEVPWFWYVSGFFGILYAILIPSIFVLMISIDYRVILVDYSISFEKKALTKFTKSYLQSISILKRLKFLLISKLTPKILAPILTHNKPEKEILHFRSELERIYERATDDFNSASSFLYSPYKRPFRYYRIYHLVFRFILCAIASIAFQWPHIQVPLAAGVVLLHCIALILTRPYIDNTSTFSEAIVGFNVVLNILYGYYVTDQKLLPIVSASSTSSIILFTMNAITILIVAAQLLIIPIRFIFQKITFKKFVRSNLENVGDQLDQFTESGKEIELENINQDESRLEVE